MSFIPDIGDIGPCVLPPGKFSLLDRRNSGHFVFQGFCDLSFRFLSCFLCPKSGPWGNFVQIAFQRIRFVCKVTK